jgi:type IV pilus assembly protein PilA
LAVAAEAKTTIAEFAATNGSMPATAADAGITLVGFGPDSYVEAANYSQTSSTVGVYTITISGGATDIPGVVRDSELSLRGTLDQGSRRVSWLCGPGGGGGTAIDAKYLPASCRNTLP